MRSLHAIPAQSHWVATDPAARCLWVEEALNLHDNAKVTRSFY